MRHNQSQEGEQALQFGQGWRVLKVDEHPYYRYISGQGLKAVDYMALHPDWGLYLIELKDYRQPLTDEQRAALEVVLMAKVNDTKTLIRSVVSRYRKTWRYRYLIPRRHLHWIIPARSRIWIDAYDLIVQNRCVGLSDIVSL